MHMYVSGNLTSGHAECQEQRLGISGEEPPIEQAKGRALWNVTMLCRNAAKVPIMSAALSLRGMQT